MVLAEKKQAVIDAVALRLPGVEIILQADGICGSKHIAGGLGYAIVPTDDHQFEDVGTEQLANYVALVISTELNEIPGTWLT